MNKHICFIEPDESVIFCLQEDHPHECEFCEFAPQHFEFTNGFQAS